MVPHATMKEKVRNEYYRRVRLVRESEQYPSCARLTYSFNIIKWKMSEIKSLDAKTRKLLTIHRMHHPKADVKRMYLPRRVGGRGLTPLETGSTTVGLETYLRNSDDALLQLVLQHDAKKNLLLHPKRGREIQRRV